MHSVLFIGHEATRTGAPVSLLNTVRELTVRGVKCRVILLRGGPLTANFAAVCETHVIRAIKKMQPPPSHRIIVRELRKIVDQLFALGAWLIGAVRLRMVLSHVRTSGIQCAYVNSAVSAGIIAQLKKYNIPVIAHIHELQSGFVQSGHPLNLALMLSYATYIIAPCEAVKSYLVSSHGVNPSKIVIIPEAVEDAALRVSDTPQAIRAREGIPADAYVIAMAGTIDWRKGIDLFIALGRILAPLLPHARFVWIGGGHQQSTFLQTWKTFYGIDEEMAAKFLFTGERPDIAPLLSAIDVFTLTSREDPCPLVHIEAAMLKKPVICFAGTGGAPEWLGNAGIVVPYQDVQAMVQAVLDSARNPERARSMGEAGRMLMVPRCLSSTVAAQVEGILNSV